MAAQALLGLVFRDQYRDAEPIRSTWPGNDGVTLLLALPLLAGASLRARRGSTRGVLVWLGVLGYAVYNYAFYLFGAALNTFFLLYVAAFVLAALGLIRALADLDVQQVASSFRPAARVRALGGGLVAIGAGLAAVWVAMWSAYVFAGRPLPIHPEAFKVVAALDLSLMVPALVSGGVLLWRRQPWGYTIAAIGSIQGALYLIVLCINAAVAIRRGLATAPGELPIWGVLLVVTSAIALLLLANARPAGSKAIRHQGT